jgi:hypothetical protein
MRRCSRRGGTPDIVSARMGTMAETARNMRRMRCAVGLAIWGAMDGHGAVWYAVRGPYVS